MTGEDIIDSFITSRGTNNIGTIQSTFTKDLYDRVRKRTNKTKEELPNKLIKKILLRANKEIANWIVENPEGFEIGSKMGFLVASKHLPKEFRTDKEETIKKIESLDIKETVRKKYLKRWNVDIGRRVDYQKLKELGELIPQLNLHSFFYTYRIMWFNKRNTNFMKSQAYHFKPARSLTAELYNKIMENTDYYEWDFSAFYRYKMSPKKEFK